MDRKEEKHPADLIESIFQIIEQLNAAMQETREILRLPALETEKSQSVETHLYPEKFDTKRLLANSRLLMELSERLREETDLLESNTLEQWLRSSAKPAVLKLKQDNRNERGRRIAAANSLADCQPYSRIH